MKPEERLLKYVSFGTNSSEESTACPSTACQLELAAYLEKELKELGLSEVQSDGTGYVYAVLPASEGCEDLTPMGFVAHMDTSSQVPGDNIKARIIEYNGGDIALSDKVSIAVADYPFLDIYKGQHLMITDGTTLLGADDKAGIAEITTAMEFFLNNPQVKHGKIYICFNPDEEVGRGMERVDLNIFKPEFAYTVDGGRLGGMEYECFNAASAKITVNGVSIHPGSAKNKMKNAAVYAAEFISMLPVDQSPAHTQGYEGFYHVTGMSGNESEAKVSLIIRDHDRKTFEERKAFIAGLSQYMNLKYGEGTFETVIKDGYSNMKETFEGKDYIIDKAKAAMRENGVEPVITPIRGGTDGSALSFMGIPTPNLSTGGENFHGVREFVSIEAMNKMVDIIVSIAKA